MQIKAQGTSRRPLFVEFTQQILDMAKIKDSELAASEVLNVFLPSLLQTLHLQQINSLLTGSDGYERFQSFEAYCSSESFVRRLLLNRPDLVARLHDGIVRKRQFKNWVNKCITVDFQQLADCSMISKTSVGTFGLQSVTGDWHNNRPTARVTFGENSLYLKNRTAANSNFAHHIWDCIKSHDKYDELLDLQWENAITIGNHSWDTETQNSPLRERSDAHNYYQRLGQLLFLSYALELSDLHYENIIPSGEYPVIIDFETLGAVNTRKANQQLDGAYLDIIKFQQESILLRLP